MAGVTGHSVHVGFDFGLNPVGGGFLIPPLQVGDDPLKGSGIAGAVAILPHAGQLDFLPLGAVEQDVNNLLGQLPNGGV